MTDAQLAEIKARAEAATPGPWDGNGGSITDWKPEERTFTMEFVPNRRTYREDVLGMPMNCDKDMAFIAHARTDVPALLAEVDVLRQIIGDQREESGMDRRTYEQGVEDGRKMAVDKVLCYLNEVELSRESAVNNFASQRAMAIHKAIHEAICDVLKLLSKPE